MNNKAQTNHTPSYSNFGYSSILLMFIMICIVTFSVLALYTATSDYTLSKKVATNTSNYYAAEEKAYTTLSEIDLKLSSCYINADGIQQSEEEFYMNVQATFKATEINNLTIDEEKHLIQYQEKISNNQRLVVEINYIYPEANSDSFYTIKRWQTVSDVEEGSSSLNVIK